MNIYIYIYIYIYILIYLFIIFIEVVHNEKKINFFYKLNGTELLHFIFLNGFLYSVNYMG